MAIPNNYKNSLVVAARQLPQFIRNDESYKTFIAFLEAYYEWFATEKNIDDRTKNIVNYFDIDNTIDEFEEYFFNTFIKHFPTESLTNRRELVKFSKKFYESKSVPASFKFLFRSVYDSDAEVYNTSESVLIASDGKWVQSRSLRIKTFDPRFLNINNLKIIGEDSKSIAKIERTQIVTNYIEVYLSDIIREFVSGEYIRIVDDNLKDVYIDGQTLRAKVIGFIKSLEINPNYRGLRYKPGDPVVIKGGINPEIENPKNAVAVVKDVTVGGLDKILVKNGSYGFRIDPNTTITITNGGPNAYGAKAKVTKVANTNSAPVTNVPVDKILPYANTFLDALSYGFPEKPLANNTTELLDALTFVNFMSFPLEEILVTQPGYYYEEQPILDADSWTGPYEETRINLKSVGILGPIDVDFGGYNYANGNTINFVGGSGFGAYANVTNVDANGSILQVEYNYDDSLIYPLGGWGYSNRTLPDLTINSAPDKIYYLEANTDILAGTRRFYYKTLYNYLGPVEPYKDVALDSIAYGFWTNPVANANTVILDAIRIVTIPNFKRGMFVSGRGIANETTYNYFESNTRITNYSNTNNWIDISTDFQEDRVIGDIIKVDGTGLLSIPTILGDGEELTSTSDTIGAIINFDILDPGEEYIGAPDVYLSIIDVAVVDVNELNLPQKGDIIYQGAGGDEYPTFMAYFDSLELIPNQLEETFRLRVYSYTGFINASSTDPLKVDRINATFTIKTAFNETYSGRKYTNGILVYGNGKARANANFLNGTVIGKGKYLNEDGFPSSYNVLESMVYNDFTYILTVEKEFSVYKEVLYNLLHPSGKQAITRNAVNSSDELNYSSKSSSQLFNHRRYPINELLNFAGDNIFIYATPYPLRDVGIGDVQYDFMDRPLSNLSSTLESSLLFDTDWGIYGVLIDENKLEIRNAWKHITQPKLSDILTTNSNIYMTSQYGELIVSGVSGIDNANNIITLEDYTKLNRSNVALGYSVGNSIIVTNVTEVYDYFNGGVYTDSNNKLIDIVYESDYISIGNNNLVGINSIDSNNWIIYTDQELTEFGNVDYPALISVTKNYISNNILVDYVVRDSDILASGFTVDFDDIDGFEILDEGNNVINITTEI